MARYLRYNVPRSLFSIDEQITLRYFAGLNEHYRQIGDLQSASVVNWKIGWLCVKNLRADREYGGDVVDHSKETAAPVAPSLSIVKH